ncbi:MAG: DUF6504 family protein [Chloroflexota bacterium]
MTRLWPDGQPIAVISNAGQEPGRFTWQGQTHQVVEITKVWRVDMDWWRRRVWRAYYKLRTDTGLLVVLYQDLLTEEWHLQRLYD